eukprot:gene10052-8909_t
MSGASNEQNRLTQLAQLAQLAQQSAAPTPTSDTPFRLRVNQIDTGMNSPTVGYHKSFFSDPEWRGPKALLASMLSPVDTVKREATLRYWEAINQFETDYVLQAGTDKQCISQARRFAQKAGISQEDTAFALEKVIHPVELQVKNRIQAYHALDNIKNTKQKGLICLSHHLMCRDITPHALGDISSIYNALNLGYIALGQDDDGGTAKIVRSALAANKTTNFVTSLASKVAARTPQTSFFTSALTADWLKETHK